jgi:hypothetical protein
MKAMKTELNTISEYISHAGRDSFSMSTLGLWKSVDPWSNAVQLAGRPKARSQGKRALRLNYRA